MISLIISSTTVLFLFLLKTKNPVGQVKVAILKNEKQRKNTTLSERIQNLLENRRYRSKINSPNTHVCIFSM